MLRTLHFTRNEMWTHHRVQLAGVHFLQPPAPTHLSALLCHRKGQTQPPTVSLLQLNQFGCGLSRAGNVIYKSLPQAVYLGASVRFLLLLARALVLLHRSNHCLLSPLIPTAAYHSPIPCSNYQGKNYKQMCTSKQMLSF